MVRGESKLYITIDGNNVYSDSFPFNKALRDTLSLCGGNLDSPIKEFAFLVHSLGVDGINFHGRAAKAARVGGGWIERNTKVEGGVLLER